MRSEETLQLLETEGAKHLMRQLYGETAEENVNRYRHVVQKFHDTFGDQDMMLFSSPGRTEISGNHTDHNHGKVLAGSINLDCVAVGAKMPIGLLRSKSASLRRLLIYFEYLQTHHQPHY